MEPPPTQPTPPQSTDPSPSQPQPPPPQRPPQQPPSPSLPPQIIPSSSSSSNPNPNPNSNNKPPISPLPQQPNTSRPPFNRPWSQFSHFPPQFQSASSPSSLPSSSVSSSAVSAPFQRDGIAIGVPAVSSQTSSFSPSFGTQCGGIPRNPPVNVPDPVVPSSIPSPARPTMHGMPGMGMIGSQMRTSGVPPSSLHQQRPVQAASGIRPQTASNNLPPVSQNFQGHGVLRPSPVASPSSSTPSTSQSQPPQNQPWLSSAPHGRPPLPSQSFRPQVNPQSLQQRSHIPQQSPQPMPATSQPQQLSSSQQQQQAFPTSNQSPETYGQQLSSSKVMQPSANQQQIARVQGIGNQRPPAPTMVQPSVAQPSPTDKTGEAEAVESCSRILSKRSIQELVNQIDPSERLDPDMEDVLVDIAEDFIDSVATFGCSLAKHRKSNTLEAKDILLHLERNWNMVLPGFSGDEIKIYKKPVVNDVHKERLTVIKKSLTGAEVVTNKNSAGPATGNMKGHLAKATPNAVGS